MSVVMEFDPDRWAAARLTAESSQHQPRRICDLCVRTIHITGAGMSVVTPSQKPVFLTATDDKAARIEDLQIALGEGPCVDAVATGVPVLLDDLEGADHAAARRWPAFVDGAFEAGVRAVFAFPLRAGAVTVGTLDLYRDKAGGLSSAEVSAALIAADAGALAVLHLPISPEGPDETVPPFHLQVHQATGMVQEQLGIRSEAAFLALRARAFADGRPLTAVADDVVARRLRFDQEDT